MKAKNSLQPQFLSGEEMEYLLTYTYPIFLDSNSYTHNNINSLHRTKNTSNSVFTANLKFLKRSIYHENFFYGFFFSVSIFTI
jgi:hypothetical protein